VRFPGDWVGPLEELVPFGPSADRAEPAQPDFWGEDSAALQDAVEVPEPVAPSVPKIVRPRRRQRVVVLAAVGVAAISIVFAAVVGALGSGGSRPQPVTFAVANIPPLAAQKPVSRRIRHRAVAPRRHPAAARHTRPAGTTPSAASAQSTTPLPQPSYHPAPASPSSSSSASGGAFTLGGP
jgi:hypothetical protein